MNAHIAHALQLIYADEKYKKSTTAETARISLQHAFQGHSTSLIFSERHVHVRYNYVIAGPSVCRLSVTLVTIQCSRLKFSAMFLCQLVPWPSFDIQVKFYGYHPRGTPPSGELNTRGVGVAEYSDFGPIQRYISETVQDRS